MLFYHVAVHEGISEALPFMPYGIGHSALSAQMIQLERELQLTLFQRRPFQLTEPGQRLFEHAQSFFGPLPNLIDELRQQVGGPRLRIGASELIVREYLPDLVAALLAREPALRLHFRRGTLVELTALLAAKQIDVAITAVDAIPHGFEALRLARLPMVLLAGNVTPPIAAPDLNKAGRIDLPLVCSDPDDGICRCFSAGLMKRGVAWTPQVTASAVSLVPWFVATRPVVGLGFDLPSLVQHHNLLPIPLPGFEPVELVAMWRKPADGLLSNLVELLQAQAERKVKALIRVRGRQTEKKPQTPPIQ